MSTKPLGLSFVDVTLNKWLVLLLAVTGACLAALFFIVPVSFAVFSVLIIVALSAAANDAFLLSFIFLTPFSWVLAQDVIVRDVATTIRLLVVAGFFLGLLLKGRVNAKPIRVPMTVASFAFLAAALVSVQWGMGGWSHEAARTIVRVASYIFSYLFVLFWVDSLRRFEKVLSTLLVSTIFLGAFGIVQEVVGGYTSLWLFFNPPGEGFVSWEGRAASFLGYTNSLASYLNLILPLSLACCILGRGKWKRLGGVAFFISVIALICTQSRGGLVAFGCVLILAILYFVYGWRRQTMLICGLVVLTLSFYLIGSALNPEHLGELEQGSSVGRLVLWGIALNLFFGSPLYGVGIGNFQNLYGQFISIPWIGSGLYGVHNLYLQLLCETGIMGFGTFFVLIAMAVHEARRQWRSSSDFLSKALGFGVLGAITATLVHGFVDFVIETSPQVGALFWILLALLAARARGMSEKNQPDQLAPRGEPST